MENYINHYFGVLVFRKFEIHDTYTVYICPVRTYEETPKQKYVLVYVMNKYIRDDMCRINQLSWFMIMCTDKLDVNRRFDVYKFYKSHKDDDVDDTKILIAKARSYDKTVYEPLKELGWPLQVTLYHNEKLKTQYQFADMLSLHQAADTFNCTIRRTDY